MPCGCAAAAGEKDFGVGPQYDTTHVYVRPEISLRIGGHLPIRQPAIVQPVRERGQRGAGANSTRFALTRPAKSFTCSTVSLASIAS
jgi:hypothetical protein